MTLLELHERITNLVADLRNQNLEVFLNIDLGSDGQTEALLTDLTLVVKYKSGSKFGKRSHVVLIHEAEE